MKTIKKIASIILSTTLVGGCLSTSKPVDLSFTSIVNIVDEGGRKAIRPGEAYRVTDKPVVIEHANGNRVIIIPTGPQTQQLQLNMNTIKIKKK